MNIRQEPIGTQEARITIDLAATDYSEAYNKELSRVRKSVHMNGFRPGTVPKSMVQKMYGKSLLLEEINKIVASQLEKYLDDNKVHILGHPIPVPITEFDHNFDNPGAYSFSYDVGLAPQFEFQIPSAPIDYYEITVTEKDVDDSILHLQKKNSKMIELTEVVSDVALKGNIVELNDDGSVKENGISRETWIFTEYIKSDEQKSKFDGKAIHDAVVFNPKEAFVNDAEVAYLLGVKKEEAPAMNNNFSFTIINITKNEPRELGQELFDVVYGAGNVTTLENFREKIAEDVKAYYHSLANSNFLHMVDHAIVGQYNLTLPDDFLKRWIRQANEKPVTEEQIENEYPRFADDMKLRMIYNKAFASQNMEISEHDIREAAYNYLNSMFQQYGMSQMPPDMEQLIDNYLGKEENYNKCVEGAQRTKVNEYLLGAWPRNVKTITFDEFDAMQKEHQHHHHAH